MARYVVLKQVHDGTRNGWEEVGSVDEAANDLAAIKQTTSEAGTYVAVPARSWRQRTRRVENVQRDLWA